MNRNTKNYCIFTLTPFIQEFTQRFYLDICMKCDYSLLYRAITNLSKKKVLSYEYPNPPIPTTPDTCSVF